VTPILPALANLLLVNAESSGAAINRRNYTIRAVQRSALYPCTGDILALETPTHLRFDTSVTLSATVLLRFGRGHSRRSFHCPFATRK